MAPTYCGRRLISCIVLYCAIVLAAEVDMATKETADDLLIVPLLTTNAMIDAKGAASVVEATSPVDNDEFEDEFDEDDEATRRAIAAEH